ncbi:sushi, von Willebrand factor type A, EGF and pentraxin domain-containing protein 1-like [Stegodyphus dumicola]|uniref:sushi, von Willebrand factor type A, EGF and pentraxin domain-containing protein 1-like n=1 Tax=Stegodyphus dumicola TaxID=202533 RepID=UPI0015A869F9|nr:sushi, von Willebrand factor type A, EGF and pentraxin domain-containing protein 1-like [Stegodyphus dumicola]
MRDEEYEEIPVGTEISSRRMYHLRCFDGYSVLGGSSALAVICQKGKWYPNPVCLPHGVPYMEAVVTAASTSKPSVPRTVAVAELSSTESNLKLSRITTQLPTSSGADGKEVDQPHTVSVAENNNVAERCYCEYNSPDKNLVAYAGNEQVQNGYKVKFNCTLKFHCKEIGYYRFTGPKEMTCIDCRPFHFAAYPQCQEPVHSDTVIFFDGNLKVMSDGTLSLKQGVTVRLTCIGTIKYPAWTFPESGNTHTYYEVKNTRDGKIYTAVLDIVVPSSKHDGKYNCAMEGYAPTTINIKVFEIRCPAFKESEDMLIEYTAEQRSGSIATFFCGKDDVYGTSKCLETGDWSASMPSCSKGLCEPPVAPENGMIVIKPSVPSIGSIVSYACQEGFRLQGVQTTRCLETLEWTFAAPKCLRKQLNTSRCYLKDLRKKTGVSLESREVTNHNEYLDVVCDHEYTPTGEQPFCFEGKWNEHLLSPCQERSCEISRIHNGVLTERRLGMRYWTRNGRVRDDVFEEIPVGTEISSGNVRHLMCFEGYSVHGSGSSYLPVTCLKGKWYPNPVCLPHGTPYVEEGVTAASTSKPSVQRTVVVAEVSSTEPNLKLSKRTTQPPTSSNTDGPPCSLESLYQGLPDKVIILGDQLDNDVVPYGTSVPLACEDGLRLQAKAEAKCKEYQKWKIPSVRCVSGCGPIPKADNSQLIIEPEKEFYVFGEAVIFSCPLGHTLTSELQLVVCLGNTWSADEFPDCKNV